MGSLLTKRFISSSRWSFARRCFRMDGRSDRSLGKRSNRVPKELASNRCTAHAFKTKLNTLTLWILVILDGGRIDT